MLTTEQMLALHAHHDWLEQTANNALATLRSIPVAKRDTQLVEHIKYYRHMRRIAIWSRMFIGKNLRMNKHGESKGIQLAGPNTVGGGRSNAGEDASSGRSDSIDMGTG